MSTVTATWLAEVLGAPALEEGTELTVRGQELVVRDGIPRARQLLSGDQAETTEMFGFKWTQEDTFTRPRALELMRGWLESRYGRVSDAPWWGEYGERPLVLDAGCGAGVSGLEVFGPMGDRVRYLGADLTPAVDVARRRFAERGLDAAFLQADLTRLPLAPGSVDVIFSEGVLHHTDSTEGALKAVAPLLRPGGRILFYVYRRKSLIREFTDDAIRAQLQEMTPEQAWTALEPLTKLGIALGELGVEVDVPEDVDVLGIKAGRVDLQRLFYYDVFKAYYDPDMTFGEMHHINFDWYAPKNAFRQTEEEVRRWCDEAGLDVEHEHIHRSGITIVGRKR
jgi:SAM-dependent methyltransferase